MALDTSQGLEFELQFLAYMYSFATAGTGNGDIFVMKILSFLCIEMNNFRSYSRSVSRVSVFVAIDSYSKLLHVQLCTLRHL